MLEKERKQIDHIDCQLVQLLEERFRVVDQVAQYKKDHDIPVLDQEREKAVVTRALSRLQDYSYDASIASIFQHMMNVSKEHQTIQMDE